MSDPVRKPIQLEPSALLPMLHVSLMLLVLAMVVTPAPGGPYLPSAATGVAVGRDPLTVAVDRDGKFFLLESSGWNPVVDTDLPGRLRALVASRPGVARLYLTADRNAPYDRVLILASAARSAGLHDLDLATECPHGRESLLRTCAR